MIPGWMRSRNRLRRTPREAGFSVSRTPLGRAIPGVSSGIANLRSFLSARPYGAARSRKRPRKPGAISSGSAFDRSPPANLNARTFRETSTNDRRRAMLGYLGPPSFDEQVLRTHRRAVCIVERRDKGGTREVAGEYSPVEINWFFKAAAAADGACGRYIGIPCYSLCGRSEENTISPGYEYRVPQ